MLLDISKLPVFVYLTSILPLIPLIILFSWIACLYGLEFMILHLTGSDPIFQIVCSASSVHTISLRLSCYGVPQGFVLGPFFSHFIPPLSSFISSLSLNHHLYTDSLQAALGSIATPG